jgi:hypothetical protein
MNADNIVFLSFVQPLAKLHQIAVPTVSHHRPVRNTIRSRRLSENSILKSLLL